MNNWAGIKIADPTGDKTEDHETFETPGMARGHFNHVGIYCDVEPIGEPIQDGIGLVRQNGQAQ